MGLRGFGARPLKERQAALEALLQQQQPWDDRTLPRWRRVALFCEHLSVTSGPLAHTKFKLRSWQRRFIETVYRETATGDRPVRTAVLSMGRKNGKTALAAALGLCHLSGPEAENRGEVYCCANDRFQATKIFNEMVAMIDASPYLTDRTNISRFNKHIEDLINDSICAALTAEAKTKMGLSPSFVVYDELGQTSGRELYDAMDSALGGRKEPLLLVISTQAADDFAPLSQLIDYGLRINNGDLKDPAFHLTLYSAPEDANPWDRKTWKAANPALADFRSLADVKRLAGQAQRMPAQENAFRNLILNQRVAANARFLEPQAWRACSGAAEIPVGGRVWCGLDLGSTKDLTALAVVYEDKIKDLFHVKLCCWIPGDPKGRAEQEKAPYDAWVRQGLLIAIGASTNPRVIANKIAEINGRNRISGLAFDRWRMAEIKRELDAIGCSVPLVAHGQGFKDMSSAVNIIATLVAEQKIRHGGNPVLAMCAQNAVVTRDAAGGSKFDKAKSTGRIDALVALAMALSIAKVQQSKPIDIDTLIA